MQKRSCLIIKEKCGEEKKRGNDYLDSRNEDLLNDHPFGGLLYIRALLSVDSNIND